MTDRYQEYQNCISTKDGIYTLKEYKDEKELERFVVTNADEVFGKHSIYFDIKERIRSDAKTRITDGLLLDLNNPNKPMFWIVEIELSKHDPYKEIEVQINGFIRALRKEETINKVSKTIYQELKKDQRELQLVRKVLGDEVFYGLVDLLSDNCGIIIIIDKITKEIEELKQEFSDKMETRLIEFKTYERNSEVIHVFTPLIFESKRLISEGISKTTYLETNKAIDIVLEKVHSAKKWALIPIPAKYRRFFPAYKVNFVLETDIGEIETRVTSAKKGTRYGDPMEGKYIQGNLRKWFINHPELNDGSVLRIEAIDSGKRYKLSIIPK